MSPIFSTSIVTNEHLCIKQSFYKSGAYMAPHHHEYTAISMVLEGVIYETVDGITRTGTAGQTIIKPAGIIHQDLYSEDCLILCLYLKKKREQKLLHQDVLKEWNWIQGIHQMALFKEVILNPDGITGQQCLNDLVSYLTICQQTSSLLTVPAWLLDVKNYLDNNYDEPVNITQLAARYKVHRVYIARVFRRYFGQNIKAYIKNIRLHHATASLLKEEKGVQAALQNGYVDQSHFNRNFKAVFGTTPRTFKKLMSN